MAGYLCRQPGDEMGRFEDGVFIVVVVQLLQLLMDAVICFERQQLSRTARLGRVTAPLPT